MNENEELKNNLKFKIALSEIEDEIIKKHSMRQ